MTEPFVPLVVPRPPRNPIHIPKEPNALSSVTSVARHVLNAPVTDVSFSPVSPYDLSATSGFSVSLIGSRAGTLRRTVERFRDTPHSAHFKPDGKLLVVGCGNAARVFDLGSRAVLRSFKGHQSSVRSVKFTTDGRRVLTASDDSIVKAWDLATEKCMVSLTDATDNVRAQNSSPASQHVWITGSHDRKARLYDLRSSKCIFTLDHGYQVDDVHILPGGARAITVGGMYARVWDFFSGGKVVHNFSSHSKAITSAAVCERTGRFATAGLDASVKIHDINTFRTKGHMRFESAIFSVDVTEDGVKYAAGMANGTVDLRSLKASKRHVTSTPQSTDRKEREFEGYGRGFEKVWQEPKAPRPGTERYFNRGRNARPYDDDFVVEHHQPMKLADYDRSLKKFAHTEALDRSINTKKPAVVVSVIEELISRGALTAAVAGREQEELLPMLSIIRQYIREQRYSRYLTHLMNVILDIYGAEFGRNEVVDKEMRSILELIHLEVVACQELSSLQGTAETILGVSTSIS